MFPYLNFYFEVLAQMLAVVEKVGCLFLETKKNISCIAVCRCNCTSYRSNRQLTDYRLKQRHLFWNLSSFLPYRFVAAGLN